jgi:hypothetical protein
VVNTQSSRIKLDEVGKFEVPSAEELKEADAKITKTTLFETVMGSINPFS